MPFAADGHRLADQLEQVAAQLARVNMEREVHRDGLLHSHGHQIPGSSWRISCAPASGGMSMACRPHT